ncbi:MAG: hypothetical protein MIO87_01270 [Methanomassiliicoccales archaeon]|nr:hypothetical protein [Methanomassiliicoccales archaeon]
MKKEFAVLAMLHAEYTKALAAAGAFPDELNYVRRIELSLWRQAHGSSIEDLPSGTDVWNQRLARRYPHIPGPGRRESITKGGAR